MAYALLGLFVVIVIAQAVLLWKANQDWRWFDMVAIIVTTILAVVFVYPTAGVLASRSAWNKVKQDIDVQYKQVVEKQKELRYGDANNPLATNGVLPMAQRLAKLGTEAGRKWRNLRLNNANFGGQTAISLARVSDEPPVDGVPADDDANNAAAPTTPLIPIGMVVYGFAETQVPGVDTIVPTFYLGEFRVTGSDPNSVTLTTTGPLLPQQQRAITDRQAISWSLYELLPLDGHQPFIAEGSVSDDDNIFGRVDDDLINRILAGATEETRKNYLRDGTRSQSDDPPLTRWVKIEFLKPFSIVVDSPDQRGALDGGFFDGLGRAVDGRLQAGGDGKIQFAKGDLLIVKEEAFATFQQEGVARLVDTYYQRPLNDYRFVLRRIRLRLAELTTRTEELNFEKDILQRAVDATVKMLTQYQTEKLQLEQDLSQTEVERKSLESYNTNLREEVKARRAKLVNLYRSNQTLEAELEAAHRSIETQVDSLTSTR